MRQIPGGHLDGPTKARAALAIGIGFVIGACQSTPTSQPSDTLTAFVSIAPQSYFVKRIGGQHVEVHVLVGPGQSHHSYEPTPRQIVELSRARAYFRIGVPFERGLAEKIGASQKNLAIVDTSEGVALRTSDDACYEDGHDHAHDGGKDPHVWLDPKRVKIQATTIAAALCRLDSAHRADYERNLRALNADLDALDAKISKALAPLKGREFYVFHPAYGYFADAYGLRQVAVEEEGKEPSLKRIEQLIGRAKKSGVKLIFMQPQFPTAAAKTVADAIGGAVVPLDPMSADYLNNMSDMARQIATALGQAATGSNELAGRPLTSHGDVKGRPEKGRVPEARE